VNNDVVITTTDEQRLGSADLLGEAAARAARYRGAVRDVPVFPGAEALDALRAGLGTLRDEPAPAQAVIAELADAVEPALVASAGPRYFGFVIGGALDSATAADILAAGWDQNAFNTLTSPAAAVVEEVAGEWLKDVLGLPASASFAFTTGGQAANTVCLAAARHQVLADAGWDVERDGLVGAPRVRVVAGALRHITIDRSLRLLGLGASAVEPVPVGDDGAIDVAALARVLADGPAGPVIVCLQAGEVNSGAFDDFPAAIAVAREHGARAGGAQGDGVWVHVDGAFGLWAGASPATRGMTDGVAGADSWATDGHKWLNVPYDSGYAFCARPAAHKASMAFTAAYLGDASETLRSPGDWNLESSRRARGFATWAALRELGRSGVAALVEDCCAHARRFADLLAAEDGVRVVHDVVLNQVLVRFGEDDGITDRTVAAVQRSGVCWMGGTTWRGMRLMRISVSGWQTTAADVDLSVAAILAAYRAVRG
jgi:glutamate/tyrosine decarboxylase-like PLP-dependent enzyme